MSGVDESNLMVSEAHLLLDLSRKEKAEQTKDIGSPIQLPGKALSVHVLDNDAWIAENTTVIRKLDLETGKTLQIYRGHTGPVTCIAFFESEGRRFLISGSWDTSIKIWDRETKALISSTDAHTDFVKTLLVLPEMKLLISGSSDKIVRFWDLSNIVDGQPLSSAGSISSHTRPVECLAAKSISQSEFELCTGDTMGVIKIWTLTKDASVPPRWRSSLKYELNHHRTRINEMHYGNDQLWTASADDTVQVVSINSSSEADKVPRIIAHQTAVRCLLPIVLTDLIEPYLITGAGDTIRSFDISSLQEPDLLGAVDAHWHDVTNVRLWMRKTTVDGQTRIEPWIISASLDGTLRKWKLAELLNPPPALKTPKVDTPKAPAPPKPDAFALSEEEERELAELMDD